MQNVKSLECVSDLCHELREARKAPNVDLNAKTRLTPRATYDEAET